MNPKGLPIFFYVSVATFFWGFSGMKTPHIIGVYVSSSFTSDSYK